MAPRGLLFQRHGRRGEGREGLASLPPPPSSVMLSQRCGKQTQPIGRHSPLPSSLRPVYPHYPSFYCSIESHIHIQSSPYSKQRSYNLGSVRSYMPVKVNYNRFQGQSVCCPPVTVIGVMWCVYMNLWDAIMQSCVVVSLMGEPEFTSYMYILHRGTMGKTRATYLSYV
jgi:hypothetical protein